ncbi:MAG TPA: tetratricopeptide repeat protein [Gammaproteobacteria bacterium]|nr:tetratricopeptide repeat protein [Gammaproteobacteria bacterium]
MGNLNHVFDGTRENFRQLVIDNSHRGAVLVNYWTPGAGPCFRLWQVLEKLSEEYQGRFLLVNINTDAQKSLARDNGITSVPTVKIYHRGDVVESIHGAQSEGALRSVIDKHVQPAQDTALAQALRSYQSGNVSGALEILAEASAERPDDLKLYSTAIKLLLREKRYADIEICIASMPHNIRSQAEISNLQVHAKMLHLAQQAPAIDALESELEKTPDAIEARLSRAALAMLQDDYETALTQLLEACRHDRYYADELPRRAMLAIFSLLGDTHEQTRRFQNAMREVLAGGA